MSNAFGQCCHSDPSVNKVRHLVESILLTDGSVEWDFGWASSDVRQKATRKANVYYNI